ncbi:MAG: hypothetical protein RR338_03760, partial [Clostridia bacterium]
NLGHSVQQFILISVLMFYVSCPHKFFIVPKHIAQLTLPLLSALLNHFLFPPAFGFTQSLFVSATA